MQLQNYFNRSHFYPHGRMLSTINNLQTNYPFFFNLDNFHLSIILSETVWVFAIFIDVFRQFRSNYRLSLSRCTLLICVSTLLGKLLKSIFYECAIGAYNINGFTWNLLKNIITYRSESLSCVGPKPKVLGRSHIGRRNWQSGRPSVRRILFPWCPAPV